MAIAHITPSELVVKTDAKGESKSETMTK